MGGVYYTLGIISTRAQHHASVEVSSTWRLHLRLTRRIGSGDTPVRVGDVEKMWKNGDVWDRNAAMDRGDETDSIGEGAEQQGPSCEPMAPTATADTSECASLTRSRRRSRASVRGVFVAFDE